MDKLLIGAIISGLAFLGSGYYMFHDSGSSNLSNQDIYSVSLEEAFKSNERFLEKQQKIYSERAEKAENKLIKLEHELEYRDEQIKKLGGEVKTLEDKTIQSSISYLGETYPIINGWQEDVDKHEIAWIDSTAYYKNYYSDDQDMSPKLSVDDNIGLYLAAYSKLDFAKTLRDKVDTIVYTDSENKQKTYILTKTLPIKSGAYISSDNDEDEEIYKYVSGNTGNTITIQTTYDNGNSELLIFEPVE